ncbi:MAG TPA: CDP-archaeol synthase, partial [Prolixibacteraceae bacterium]|nr:CDP-archaeol synthase [Prolixibacteraceae bacterium]
YLFGRWLGRHKLIESVSPKKTWEGFVGGLIFSSLVSIVVFQAIDYSTPLINVALAVLTGVSGTLGDLTESLIKRNCGEKDSGKLIPGHGGLLDRFDSLLFSLPVFYAFISIFS